MDASLGDDSGDSGDSGEQSPAALAAANANPNTWGQDYARWAEYALTLPFQVFVVVTLFFVGERNLLLCLSFLQGLLELMGYGIELVLFDVITGICSGDESRVAGWLCCALGLVVYAVAAHCIIWGVLVGQFQDIVQNAYNCQKDSEMPVRIIDTLLSGQCFLFLLVGVVVIF